MSRDDSGETWARDFFSSGGDSKRIEPGIVSADAPLPNRPLTPRQTEISLYSQLGAEASCVFNEGFSIVLEGEFNEAALRSAIATVITRHESLRSTLNGAGNGLTVRAFKLAFPLLDLSGWKRNEAELGFQDQYLSDLQERELWTPFDLSQGPLVRVKLIRVSAQRHVLLFTAHQLICDQASMNALLDEIAKRYSANCRGQKVRLARAFSTARPSTDETLHELEAELYWQSQFFEPPPALDLPVDYPRPSSRSHYGATFASEINADLQEKVLALSERQGCSPFATFLSAFDLLLTRHSRQSDIVIGVPCSTRNDGHSEERDGATVTLAGQHENYLPVRVRTRANMNFRMLLAEAQQKLIGAEEHSAYSYQRIVRELAPPRGSNRLPLIEATFNLQRSAAENGFEGLSVRIDRLSKRFVHFDIALNLVETPQGIRVYFDYNADLFDENTIARWMGDYQALLDAACENAEQAISQLPLSGSGGGAVRKTKAPALDKASVKMKIAVPQPKPIARQVIYRHRINLTKLFG